MRLTVWSAYGVRIAETWFSEPSRMPPAAAADLVVHNFFKSPRSDATAAHTILIDLRSDSDELLSQMKQDTRYKIRRADTKDGLTFEAYSPQTIAKNAEILTEFLSFFNAFAQDKGLSGLNRPHLDCQAASGILYLTRAAKDSRVLVWHAYIADNGRVRLRNSASHFRGEDSATTNLIGRANRWLHWKDMLAFRDAGISVYDFGGWYSGTTEADWLRINRFKEGFGGVQVKEYSCELPLSLKGHAFALARHMRDRMRTMKARAAKPSPPSGPTAEEPPST